MKSEIFKDLLSENEIKQVMKSIYDPWNTRDKLSNNVSNTVMGLRDLLTAVNNAQIVVNDNDTPVHILEGIKNNYDMIAYLLENFITEFKPLYEEASAKSIAAKLTYEENHDGKEGVVMSGHVTGSHSKATTGWSKY